MDDVTTVLIVMVLGAALTAALTKRLVSVVLPKGEKNTWKNSTLVGFSVALITLGTVLVLPVALQLGLAVRSVALGGVLLGCAVVGALLARLFDMPLDDAVPFVPVVGISVTALLALLHFAVATLSAFVVA